MKPVSRRSALALLGSGLAGLAGCSGQPREEGVPVPEKSTHTPTADPPTLESPTERTDTEEPTPDHETIRWWVGVGDDGPVAPAVADGTVYVGGSGPVWTEPGTPPGPPHRLLALDLADGSQRWAFETGPGVDATPVVRDGTVYVVSGVDFGLGGHNYRLDAVDAATGSRQWQFALDESLYLNLLAVAGGSVVLGTNDDQLSPAGEEYTYALDVTTGERRWRTQYADVVFGSAAGPVVYLPAPGGLYAVDSRTGEEWWRFESDSLFAPVVLGDTLLVDEDSLTALDATTGEVNWRRQGAERDLGAWDASSGGVFGTNGDDVVGVDVEDGTERWRVGLSGRRRSVSAWRERVIVADENGPVVALDGRDGTKLWVHRSNEIDRPNDIVVGERGVYVVHAERTAVVALDTEDGRVRWRFAPGGELTTPVRADDTVLVGSSDGFLYALDP